jgi:trk system potassium uptake protein TrkA
MAPKDKWVGKTLKELNLRKKYGVNVIAIKDGVIKESIDPDEPLKAENPLIMILHKNNLSKLDKGIIL